MDKFVVRLPRGQENPFRHQNAARPLKQMTIESLRGVVVFEDFDRAKLVLSRANSSSEDKLDVLAGIAKKTPSADIVASTGLGDILRSLSNHPDKRVAAEATRVADYWRTCNLRKANRASIEVRYDARTQKLRDAARRMIHDSLKSTLISQTGHRGKTEISSPAGNKRRRHGDGCGVGDDTCESVAIRVDESLVSDVGCVVSQTSLGYSKGIRIDLDRYNSMMDSLDARGNSDGESSDEDDDALFCNESNSQADETLGSSRIGVELLRDIDIYLDSQIAKTKNVGCKGSRMTPDKDDKSLHWKDRARREGNNLIGDEKVSCDTKRALQNEGANQNAADESNRHSNKASELKVKHSHKKNEKIRACERSNPRLPDELHKGVGTTTSTDDGYVGSCESQSSVENCALKAKKSPSSVGAEFQSKRKRRCEDKGEERHHKRAKTEPTSSQSVDNEHVKSLCPANENTNSVLVDPGKEEAGTLKHHTSLSRNDIQEEFSSIDVLVGENVVSHALCETNLNEPHSNSRSFSSKEKSHKKSKKRSKDEPERRNSLNISDSKTTDECIRSRESKKYNKIHDNSEPSRSKDASHNSTLDVNKNGRKSAKSSDTNNKENSSELFYDSISKLDVSRPSLLKKSIVKVCQQQRSSGEEISFCSKKIKREDLETTHEEDCTASHCPELPVGIRGSSASPEGVPCSEVQNFAFKDEYCSDSTLLCQLSPSIKTTCKTTHKRSDNTNPVIINVSTSAKQRCLENESNPYISDSAPTREFTSKVTTSTEKHSSVPRRKSSSSRKESCSCRKVSSSSRMESSSSMKDYSSSKKESSSYRKESSSSRQESKFSKKKSSFSVKESSSSHKESSSSHKESSSSHKESSSSHKESSFSHKESSSSHKVSSSSHKESSSSHRSSSSHKKSSSSHKDSNSSHRESSSSSKKCISSLNRNSFSRNEFSSSRKESSFTGKEFSAVNEKLNSPKLDPSISKELDCSSKESDSSTTKLNAANMKSDSSRIESTASRKEFSISEKGSRTSREESNTTRNENRSSKKKSSSSIDESSWSKSEKESSLLKKNFNSSGQDSKCTKKSSSSTTCSSSGKLKSSTKCVRPLDAAEAALLSETIERELFQATQRLVSKRYKQTVRKIVFALKHQDRVRRKFLRGKLTARDIVNSYTEEG